MNLELLAEQIAAYREHRESEPERYNEMTAGGEASNSGDEYV